MSIKRAEDVFQGHPQIDHGEYVRLLKEERDALRRENEELREALDLIVKELLSTVGELMQKSEEEE